MKSEDAPTRFCYQRNKRRGVQRWEHPRTSSPIAKWRQSQNDCLRSSRKIWTQQERSNSTTAAAASQSKALLTTSTSASKTTIHPTSTSLTSAKSERSNTQLNTKQRSKDCLLSSEKHGTTLSMQGNHSANHPQTRATSGKAQIPYQQKANSIFQT